MAKLFNGMINFASAIKPTGAQPLDDRTVVKSLTDLYDGDTFGLAKYDGMIVAVTDEQKLFMLVDATNSTSKESWVEVGADNGSLAVETYVEAVALATTDNIGQVIYVKTNSSYDADGEGDGEAIEYESAPYIVTGNKTLMKLAASTASGSIESDVVNLTNRVTTLEETVGNEEGGLVKDITDLQEEVKNITIPVTDVTLDGVSVVTDGVAEFTSPDLSDYVKSTVVEALDERVTKTEGDITTINGSLTEINGTLTDINTELDKKVDKVEGERLMTDAEGSKLEGIEAGAQVNKIEIVKVNGSAITIADSDKSVDIIVPTAPVQGIADDEKVLSLNGDKLSTTLKLEYVPAKENEKAVLRLVGKDDKVVSTMDATELVKDGMLSGAELVGPKEGETGEKYLALTFNTDAGKEEIRLNVSELIDYYNAGDGLDIDGKTFKVKVDETSNKYLQVTTNGISVSQDFINEINRLDNVVLEAAKSYADTKDAETLASAKSYADTKDAETLASAKSYTNEKDTAMDNRVKVLEAIKHDDYALKSDVYDKETANITFVQVENFNEFTQELETKLDGIEEGAQVNKIETVTVNGVSAEITEKNASITIESDDINLGVAIVNGEEEVYGATEKVSSVLQGIQDSIVGAINNSLTGVTAGDGISVSEVSENKQTVSVKVSADTNNLLKVKEDGSLFVAMYYDGDDVEE